jgi:plasmid stabilization system protein ParE
MAPVTVRFHPAAAREAESAYDWYAARNPSAAHGFREELRQAIDAVAGNPLTWPRHGRRARRYVFPRFPFSLVYRTRGDEVEVLAIAHGRRRPGYWRSRL